jgi:bifunctional UDP-N-acetylglucosamine pyrophosphorylase/glucosamine-1-phosphate N-acetyltransferase
VVDSTLGDDVTVRNHCDITESRLESGTAVGPFAHLRPGSVLETASRVGNFVELKKATLGAGSKANHLSYVGDATVGRAVNIGAGTITCNFAGQGRRQIRSYARIMRYVALPSITQNFRWLEPG